MDNEGKKLQLESLEKARESLEKEMARMKESYEKSNDEYIKIMRAEHSKMLDSIDELRKSLDKTEMQLNLTTSKAMSNYNYIRELQNRSDELHKVMEKC